MIPVFGVMAVATMLGGSIACIWYGSLPKHKQEEADRMTAEFAREVFDKTVDQLTPTEAKQVFEMTRRHVG